MPLSAALIAAALPVIVTVPVPLPDTATPATEPRLTRPLVTETVVVSVSPSMSATVTALPLVALKTSAVSSAVVWLGGVVCVAASLTGLTVTVTVAVSVTPPDVTV